MDNFREEIVVRKKGKFFTSLMYVFVWISIVMFGLMAMLFLSGIMGMDFSGTNIIGLLVTGGIAFFLYFYKDNLRTEYEYAFTNGEIDFAKVLGNKRRKQLLVLRLREVEAGGYADTENYAKYDAMRDVKRIEYYLNGNERLYFLYFVREGKRQILLFEPSETLIDLMCQYSKVLEK